MKKRARYFLMKKWVVIYLKNNSWIKFEFRKMDDYWILFLGKLILSNNIVKLNKDWSYL